MRKNLIGMAALVTSIATAQGKVIFLEQFDGSNKAYAVTNDVTTSGKWVDFGSKITARDIGTPVEGYTTAAGGTETVLAGTVNLSDVQIRSDFNVGIADATLVTNISWRIRVDKNNDGVFNDVINGSDVDIFYGTNTFGSAAANTSPASGINQNLRTTGGITTTYTSDGGNGWYIVNYSFATNKLAAIRSFRLDAFNDVVTGQSFEIDWLKIEAIPESRLSLVILN